MVVLKFGGTSVAEVESIRRVVRIIGSEPRPRAVVVRVVSHARPVPHLSCAEAHDLAEFGAKVLHPGTIQPAVDRGIPVLVRNSHRPAPARRTSPARPVVQA